MATGPANNPDTVDDQPLLWDDESFFARGFDGQLIRYEGPSFQDFEKPIQVIVDDELVTVMKARPSTDSQGNILRDEQGHPIPRDTTIYDAVQELYVDRAGDEHPIPVLCHQDHMRPAGVCRVCSVLVGKPDKTGKMEFSNKPVPACWHPVKEGMEVNTTKAQHDRVRNLRKTIGTLLSLLKENHPQKHSSESDSETDTENELLKLTDRFKDDMLELRHVSSPKRTKPLDESSHLMLVNHEACILCNRCVRACDEIKLNNVIGKHGKGFRSQIAFDLNQPMGESSCVSCGECMISCPTDALTLKPTAEFRSDWAVDCKKLGAEYISGQELQKMHRFFREISPKFLDWNASAAVLWSLDSTTSKKSPGKNKPLCLQGDYGSTAYILLRGRYGIFDKREESKHAEAPQGIFAGVLGKLFADRFRNTTNSAAARPSPITESGSRVQPPQDLAEAINKLSAKHGTFIGIRTPDEEHIDPNDSELSKTEILGEMSCMNYRPRTATVVPLDDGCKFIEIRHNILYMLLRDPKAREELRNIYEQRAKVREMHELPFVSGLDGDRLEACVEFLRSNIELLFVAPGDPIFRKDLKSKFLYVVRSGYVKFWQEDHGKTRVLSYLGSGKYFGEIALLEGMRDSLLGQLPEARRSSTGRRGANCNALDHVEIFCLKEAAFQELLTEFPEVRDEFIARYRYYRETDAKLPTTDSLRRESFVHQGVFNAQKLLVLDLARCTRCDECTKACADTHQGTTRLIRDGKRIEHFLVASACRSCEDPYCLVGCPVDAIHRGRSLEIKIESHCIGCSLCANNCPYGNINMIEQDGKPRATTCDLCESVGAAGLDGEVSCVTACPHEAAFRMSGSELWSRLATSSIE